MNPLSSLIAESADGKRVGTTLSWVVPHSLLPNRKYRQLSRSARDESRSAFRTHGGGRSLARNLGVSSHRALVRIDIIHANHVRFITKLSSQFTIDQFDNLAFHLQSSRRRTAYLAMENERLMEQAHNDLAHQKITSKSFRTSRSPSKSPTLEYRLRISDKT